MFYSSCIAFYFVVYSLNARVEVESIIKADALIAHLVTSKPHRGVLTEYSRIARKMNRSLVTFAVVLILLVVGTFSQTFYKSGNCPMRNTVSSCSPRCVGDGQCSFNQKCCPNKCGTTSCADSSPVNTGSDGGYKGSSNQQVYCHGVRCAAYEKCQYDRNSRREKCMRT